MGRKPKNESEQSPGPDPEQAAKKSRKTEFKDKVNKAHLSRGKVNEFTLVGKLKVAVSRKSKITDMWLKPDEEVGPGDVEIVTEKYVNMKLFLKPGYFTRIFSLGNYGLWVFQYIHYSMKMNDLNNQVWVRIDRAECAQLTGINIKYVGKGVQELLDIQFISESDTREIYFINPKYFFFGNRVSAFPDNHVRKVIRPNNRPK